MQPPVGGYTSRISSVSAPECSTTGRRTYSASQLDHEERDAVERSRVDSCNSSPRHGGGEGVGGRRGGTDAGGGLEMIEGEGMSSAGPTSRARTGPGEEEEKEEESSAMRFELSGPKGALRLDEAAPSPGGRVVATATARSTTAPGLLGSSKGSDDASVAGSLGGSGGNDAASAAAARLTARLAERRWREVSG